MLRRLLCAVATVGIALAVWAPLASAQTVNPFVPKRGTTATASGTAGSTSSSGTGTTATTTATSGSSTASGGGSSLPLTGAGIAAVTLAGLVCLGAGTALVTAARRRGTPVVRSRDDIFFATR